MPHIDLPPGLPGIVSAFAFRPETARPMRELAEILLRGPSTLSRGDRETIAAFVSARNACRFCHASHRAAAAHNLGGSYVPVDAAVENFEASETAPKIKALLAIAERVQASGRAVSPDEIARARAEGATDLEIHDTILIAAAFCMYNRYVDGLATLTPDDPAAYDAMGQRLAEDGYLQPDGSPQAAGAGVR